MPEKKTLKPGDAELKQAENAELKKDDAAKSRNNIREFPKRPEMQPATPAGKVKQPKPPFPAQHQSKPGLEKDLEPKPRYKGTRYRPANKLQDKVALITGGHSGTGRAVATL